MPKTGIKIIFELIYDKHKDRYFFKKSDDSSSVEKTYIKINVNNMNYEDKMFYNNSIIGRNKNNILNEAKGYVIPMSKCSKEINENNKLWEKKWEDFKRQIQQEQKIESQKQEEKINKLKKALEDNNIDFDF